MNKNIKSRRSFFSKMLIAGVSGVALFSETAYARGRKGKKDKKGGGSKVQLTKAQKDKLFFIYQEEKLARDVYITLGKLYPDENTFATIQHSEQRHIDSAQKLCETYKIDISEVNESEVGNFVLPVMQTLYDNLVEQGSETLYDALEVGIYIEELDIEDLREAIEEMNMPSDVINVYGNLREGSYNHLEAFQGAVSRASR